MEWEPVIPEFTDLVIAVSGLDSLGKTIKEAAYRPLETALFLGKKETDVISPEDMIRACLLYTSKRFITMLPIPGRHRILEQLPVPGRR